MLQFVKSFLPPQRYNPNFFVQLQNNQPTLAAKNGPSKSWSRKDISMPFCTTTTYIITFLLLDILLFLDIFK